MKVNWNKKYNTIAFYSFLVICASIVFFLIVSQINLFKTNINRILSTLQPFIIGSALAYLLNFILNFFEYRILSLNFGKKLKPSSKRFIGLVCTYITAFSIIYLFLSFILPQLRSSIVGLIGNISDYVNNAPELFDSAILDRLHLDEEYLDFIMGKWNEFIDYILRISKDFIPMVGNLVKSIASSIWNIVLGIIISIYLLTDKEKFFGLSKKVLFSVFPEYGANKILEITHRSNYIFGKFLGGKILDSLIIGILTFIVISIVKIPYAILISFIIGITNIIPFFGPFIGAVPSFMIILFVSPIKALWFLIIIFIIQQIDGNIIGPKILGDSIGVSPFWILFSLLIMGKVFGLVGLIVGVPVFAIIYSIIKDIVESRLAQKGMPTKTSDYINK